MSKQIFNIKDENSYYRLPEVKRVVKMGRGENRYETIEIYAGFDIETTNIYQLDGWAAYMYHAQLCLANGKDTYVYFFRKWDQVTRFFDLIIDHYGLSSERRLVCWIANMSFEFQFMRRRFDWDQGEFDFFAKEERQPLKATYHGIEFREALSISGGSLEHLAKTFCKTQKLVGDLDYRIERNSKTILTDKEKAYCENDVVILAEFSEYMFTHYIRKYRKVPLTKTSMIMDQYKRNLRNMCKARDEKNHLSPLTSIAEYKDYFYNKAMDIYTAKYEEYGEDLMSELERKVLLHNVDQRWMDHLDAMDELKRGIYLRSYAQQDPVVAFRMESYDMFDEMNSLIREGTVTTLTLFRIRSEEDVKREQAAKITATNGETDGSEKKRPIKKGEKVGRNDPCPCGSGKKYKKCCGANE